MSTQKITSRIFAIGRGANPVLIRKFCELTGKERPRVCYLPTASGDSAEMVAWWHALSAELQFEAHVQRLFISTFDQKYDFADLLLAMDAIYIGGGNTVNMLAIWREHGIDTILKTALEQGMLLGGGSAGGICWFQGGLTDSRPKILTPMPALGWLKGSYAPHYLSEPGRRNYFHKYILEGSLPDGYGCDDTAGLYFEDGEFVQAYGSVDGAEAFRVEKIQGEIKETPLEVIAV
jgi:peptidase E